MLCQIATPNQRLQAIDTLLGSGSGDNYNYNRPESSSAVTLPNPRWGKANGACAYWYRVCGRRPVRHAVLRAPPRARGLCNTDLQIQV